MVADIVADMVADMEVDMVVDRVAEKSGPNGPLDFYIKDKWKSLKSNTYYLLLLNNKHTIKASLLLILPIL